MGQRRLCSLASLMLTSRPLWLLDEPFTALGKAPAASLTALLDGHVRRGGGLIYTDHQQAYDRGRELLLEDFCA